MGRWSQKEKDFLASRYNFFTDEQIAEALKTMGNDRTPKSIEKMRVKMGLVKGSPATQHESPTKDMGKMVSRDPNEDTSVEVEKADVQPEEVVQPVEEPKEEPEVQNDSEVNPLDEHYVSPNRKAEVDGNVAEE